MSTASHLHQMFAASRPRTRDPVRLFVLQLVLLLALFSRHVSASPILEVGVSSSASSLSSSATTTTSSSSTLTLASAITVGSSTSSLAIAGSNATAGYGTAYQINIVSDSLSLDYTVPVNPLTVDASRVGSSNITYYGEIVPFYANSSIQLNDSLIAYISCDDSSAGLAVAQASNYNPSFILLYSTASKSCEFVSSYKQYNTNLGAVFSVLSASIGKQIFSSTRNSASLLEASIVVNTTYIYNALTSTASSSAISSTKSSSKTSSPHTTTIYATQTVSPTVTNPGFSTWTPAVDPTSTVDSSSAASSSSANSDDNGGSKTAVAMIVLYSVTGLVSCFFLLIIILGAVRAHRHPERYQLTTNSDGTVQRTNRARGLAKAVLDSIPLVRLPQPPEPNFNRSTSVASGTTAAEDGIKLAELDHDTGRRLSRTESDGVSKEETTVDSAAVTANESSTAASQEPVSEDLLPSSMIPLDGCPICFEPFLPGQDLRILPCHHGFHASCVDPWLLNSSSQCPLCRVDLNLRVGEDIPDMPPGLIDADETGQHTPSAAAPAAPPAQIDEEGWASVRLNRFLDRWNAQLLPAEERRVALQRVREEQEARQRMRRLREEHLGSSEGRNTWRRFVDMRRRMFHLQQQQQQQQQQEQEEEQQSSQTSEESSAGGDRETTTNERTQ
ncbi:hypothetical protein BZA70DRAFT_281282 [Myxozyma melibiosi]|uniref:RING-type domain-containing protein n=1 Tax=Myxozyma melibiosi TaxID=54550 RepID=A0ABR1F4F2_9ASCO